MSSDGALQAALRGAMLKYRVRFQLGINRITARQLQQIVEDHMKLNVFESVRRVETAGLVYNDKGDPISLVPSNKLGCLNLETGVVHSCVN